MKEFFKKVLACFCAIAMCLSSTTLAFAQDTETMQVNDSETSSVRSFEVLEMQANVTATSHSVTVTPAKNHQLFLQLKLREGDPIAVRAYDSNGKAAGSRFTINASDSTQTCVLVNNCDGKPYTVKFVTGGVATFTLILSQTEYQ